MQKIELSQFNFFESVIDLSIENRDLDLHNNYDCSELKYSQSESKLILFFSKVVNDCLLPQTIKIIFTDAFLTSWDLTYSAFEDMRSIENIYRGRYEESSRLFDTDKEGRFYFYVSFVDGVSIELFARNVEIFMDVITC